MHDSVKQILDKIVFESADLRMNLIHIFLTGMAFECGIGVEVPYGRQEKYLVCVCKIKSLEFA